MEELPRQREQHMQSLCKKEHIKNKDLCAEPVWPSG